MKKIILALATAIFTFHVSAQEWKLDKAHTKIRFTAKYLLITDVNGELREFDGKFSSSKSDWTDLQANVTVQLSGLTTDNEKRDKHLLSDDFFNAEKYPVMTFNSTGIKMIGKGKYIITGNLTIRDVTKNVSFPLVYNGTVTDPWGNVKAGFKATGTIDRKEYGLKYSNAAATGEAVVSDNVDFTIDAVLIKQSIN